MHNAPDRLPLRPGIPNETKPNQTKPNQTKPNQTKPNQTKPNPPLREKGCLGGGMRGVVGVVHSMCVLRL